MLFLLLCLIIINSVLISHLFNIKSKNKKSLKRIEQRLIKNEDGLQQKNTLETSLAISYFARQRSHYKTIVVSMLSFKSQALLPLSGYLNFLHGIHNAYKGKVQFIVLAKSKDKESLMLLPLPPGTQFVFEDAQWESMEEYMNYTSFFKPDLLINLACEITPRAFIFANILNDGSPFQDNLELTSSHVFLVSALAYNYSKIIQTELTKEENEVLENIKTHFRLIDANKESVNICRRQFKKFYSKYKKIILFSYSTFTHNPSNGFEEMQKMLSAIPSNFLIILTIHPALKNAQWFNLFQTAASSVGILDEQIMQELTQESPPFAPLANLKAQFPNLLLERDLECYSLVKGSILEFLIPFVDGAIIGDNSKLCFHAMFFEKPIFSYTVPQEWCMFQSLPFALSGMSILDIANFNFDDIQYMSYKRKEWNKVLKFMFTRFFQKKGFYQGKDASAIVNFIEYQLYIRGQGYNENNFEFYQKEWQSIEEVYKVLKNNV